MLVNSLKINNFRSLASLRLDSLGQVNLLVGRNNCGKTSVLDAVRALSDGGSLAQLLALAADRGDPGPDLYRETGAAIKGMLTSLFHNYHISEDVYIGDEVEKVYLKFGIRKYVYVKNTEADMDGVARGKRIFLNSESELEDLGLDDEAEIRDALEVESGKSGPDVIRIFPESSYTLPSESARLNDYPCGYLSAGATDLNAMAALWDRVALTELEPKVISALKIIDPDIEAISFLESGGLVEKINRRAGKGARIKGDRSAFVRMKHSAGRVPLSSMGDGLNRLLDLVLRLVTSENGFFLLDEFENGFHYSVHEDIWRLIFQTARELSIQVFATTHSVDCVKAFCLTSEADDLDGVLYRISKPTSPLIFEAEDEWHIVRRYSEGSLFEALNSEIEVR